MPGKYHCKNSAVRFPPDFCVLLLAGQRSRGAWKEREAEYLTPATERAHTASTQQALIKRSNVELLGWTDFYHQKAGMRFYSKLKFYFVYPMNFNSKWANLRVLIEFQDHVEYITHTPLPSVSCSYLTTLSEQEFFSCERGEGKACNLLM